MNNNITKAFILVAGLIFMLSGCTAIPDDAVLGNASQQLKLRSIQSRVYETTDKNAVLRNVISTLQDLDFLIEFPMFEKIIASDTAYQSAYSDQVMPLEDKIEALLDSVPEADMLSAEYLNWESEIGKLNEQMKKANALVGYQLLLLT